MKTLIVAEYSGVQVELAKNFEMGVSNKTPEFCKMNPIGKVCNNFPCGEEIDWISFVSFKPQNLWLKWFGHAGSSSRNSRWSYF